MGNKIRIGICGFGRLGKGVQTELDKNNDMELSAIFTRRAASGLPGAKPGVKVVQTDLAHEWKDKVDVVILCGGSASDLPSQGPYYAKIFNTVDSYDTHAKASAYYASVDSSAKESGNISIISVGWDPGLFSLMRLYMGAATPLGQTYSFWGKGVSQGHSEAIRGIEGVLDAVQYSIPAEDAINRVRNGENPKLSKRETHARLCYVATAENADLNKIEKTIKEMPDYFLDYDTTVHFISLDELKANHGKLPHGGYVIHNGATGENNRQMLEFSLKLDSNPEFTASILIAFARAAYRMSQNGEVGARTIFDIPPKLLSPQSPEQLIVDLL